MRFLTYANRLNGMPTSIFSTMSKLAIELVKDYKVAIIPPSVFYSKSNEGKKMLRLCFAKNDETIKSGVLNLRKY